MFSELLFVRLKAIEVYERLYSWMMFLNNC